MKSNNVYITTADLQQKWLKGLMMSEMAIFQHADIYRKIKGLVSLVNSGPVDVGDYYDIASELGNMLDRLAGEKEEIVFRYFAERIDPKKGADVRDFRFECLDFSEQIRHLEQWRRNRRQLRIVRPASRSDG